MKSVGRRYRVLGIAFLLQFITSFSSGVFLRGSWLVPGDIAETMNRIAGNPLLVQANILLDMVTALGVVFLGAMLFVTLKKTSERIALVALGFYILEAALLSTSRSEAFSLLHLSQDYVTAADPAYLQTMANLALESMNFVGDTLHMLAFCLGAILFYYLLYRSVVVPRWLSLWGLITMFPLLVGTLSAVFGYDLPFAIYLPYVPYEFVIGLWILVKGAREG